MGYSPCGPGRVRHNLDTKQQQQCMYVYLSPYLSLYGITHIHIYSTIFIIIYILYIYIPIYVYIWGFPGGSEGKKSACNTGDLDSIPGLEKSPGGGHGNPFQYSCLENPHEQKSLAGCSPWSHKELDTTEGLSTYVYTHTHTHEGSWGGRRIYLKNWLM